MAETKAEQNQREAEAYLARAMQFLVDDFGYVNAGRVPVSSDDVIVFAYANRAVGIQVELSGQPPGETFFGGLRKLQDGEPLPYDDDHFLSFDNIARVRRPELEDLLSHNLNPGNWRGVVDTAVTLLKDNARLLTGEDWIAGKDFRSAWNTWFQRKWGFLPGEDRWPTLSDFKAHFGFLLEHGYRLAYDTSTLTPHEYGVTEELRYESPSSTVRIWCTDFRDDEWRLWHDGRQIGDVFRPRREEIESRVRLIAATLCG